MPGWNLKAGVLMEEKVSEDEFWSLFNFVFSDACKEQIHNDDDVLVRVLEKLDLATPQRKDLSMYRDIL